MHPRAVQAVFSVLSAIALGARADKALAERAGPGSGLDGPMREEAHAAVMGLLRWRGWLPEAGTDVERAVERARGLDAAFAEAAKEARRGTIPASEAFARSARWLSAERARAAREGEGAGAAAAPAGDALDPWALFPIWLGEELPTAAPPTPLLLALQTRAPLWVRAHGPEAASLALALGEEGVSLRAHPRLVGAFEVLAGPDLYRTRAFHAGRFEVQDLASQAVVAICDPRPGERWWDACAGAGGKTLALADRMRGKGTILATDPHAGRLAELKRRARRAQVQNARGVVWSGEGLPRPAKKAGFDGALVDAPCSGSGTWRRNPESRHRIGRGDLARLAALQAKLIAIVARGVKPGGRLVYATCSLARSEDEAVVERFLAASPGFALDPVEHPLTGAPTSGLLRISPADAGCDGDAMFVARLVRRGAQEPPAAPLDADPPSR